MDLSEGPRRVDKIGRNDPCWCRSGKKYKFCHLNRQDAPRLQPWDIDKQTRKLISNSKYCLHAEAGPSTCSGQIVRAHTLPRSKALAEIAEAGHVYGPHANLMSLIETKGKVILKRIGIREASTFTGFCAKHDDVTFAPVEKQVLTANAEQCFLMSYRAICRELFLKRLHQIRARMSRDFDQGLPLHLQQLIQRFASLHETGTAMGLTGIQHHKSRYDGILKTRQFNDFRRVVIRFACVPDVLSTGSFFPEFDFAGNSLQSLLSSPPLRNLAVSIMPAEGGGIAVLGWEKDSDETCMPFVESLLHIANSRLADALVRLVFEHIENTFLRPSWWEKLSEGNRQALLKRANSGTGLSSRDPAALVDDQRQYAHWPVSGIEVQRPLP